MVPRTVRETIGELAAGETVILPTLILHRAEAVTTRSTCHEGRLVAVGSPAALVPQLETGANTTLEGAFFPVTIDAERPPEEEGRGGAMVVVQTGIGEDGG